MRKKTEKIYLEILKKEVQRTFGAPLQTPTNFQACMNAIFEKTHKSISVSTLKRIFGYVPAGDKYVPSMTILNILAEFAGYENYHDFYINHSQELRSQGEKSLEELLRSTAAHLECARKELNMLCSKLGLNYNQMLGGGVKLDYSPRKWIERMKKKKILNTNGLFSYYPWLRVKPTNPKRRV